MVDVTGIIHVRRVWRHAAEPESLHFLIVKDRHDRRIKLNRSSNAALYDFLVEHAAIGDDQRALPGSDVSEPN